MRHAIFRRARLLADQQSSLSVSYLVYAVTMGFSGAIQLGLLFLLVRLLPTREFGIVALLMVSIPLVSRFATLGADVGLAIRIWKQPLTEQQADLSSVLSWTVPVIFALLGLMLIVSSFEGVTFDSVLVGCVIIAAALRSCAEIFQVMLRREGRVIQVGFVVAARAILLVVTCVSAILIIGSSASAYLIGVLVAEGVMALWALGHLHRLYGLRIFAQGSFARMKQLIRVGFPIIPGTAAALLLAAGDRFVITALLGLTATGIYALGQRLAESMVQILFVPFASAFGPFVRKVASEDESRALALIGDTALTFAYTGGVVVGFLAIFGREMIQVSAGIDYAPAATIFLLVAAAVLVYQLTQTLASYFSYSEQLHKYMWIAIAGAGANIALNVVAVQVAGIIGAAVVSLLVYEAMLIATAVAARMTGVFIVSLGRLHVPLLLLGIYLGSVYWIDQQQLETVMSVSVKTLLWVGYVVMCIIISREIRALIARAGNRIRIFLAF
jgi:O-antigen/teichoic acid export membrane protein